MFKMEEKHQSFMWKKLVKRVLICLWLIVWFWLSRLLAWLLIYYITLWLWISYQYYSQALECILLIISILISLFIEILIVYIIVLWKIRRNWWDCKLKKWLKISLIVLLFFLIISIFMLFTKGGKIPNRFGFELLYPEEMKVIHRDSCNNDYNSDSGRTNPSPCVAKPIIYLYPTIETEVNVKLWTPENLSHTYPKYNPANGRNVVAQPDGDLEDMDTWRKLYALYREWKTYAEDNFEEWFLVKWEDTISFLEEKLAILWLNEREAEEFIVYRLPQMENNKYNLIRFETKEEQDENMPLNITPTPDTVVRVMMDWKAIDEPIEIPEQELTTPERTWFTVVEWWWSPRN